MDVHFLTGTSVEHHPSEQLDSLLARDDGFVWVDIPTYDDEAARVLGSTFGFHERALALCRERNHIPTSHAYADHVFTVLHVPEPAELGRVHLVELDQFVSDRYLVTVHGPLNPEVPLEAALQETRTVLQRLEAGRLHVGSAIELSYALVTTMGRRQRDLVTSVAAKIAALERRVMNDNFRDPESLLDSMFLVRHELLTVRTMAAQSHDVYARLARLTRLLPEEQRRVFEDLGDQFDRIRSLSDGEKEFLFGVIDLYQTRVATKMTVAVERLAVLAAVTLPITALASVYGMNVIVNTRTHVPQLIVVLAVMVAMSGTLLRWTKRQGWW